MAALKISDKSGLLAARLTRAKVCDYNPLLILAIADLIVRAVRLWQDCKKNWASPRDAITQGRRHYREVLERHARAALSRQQLPESLADRLAGEFLYEFDKMNDSEVQKVISEVKR